jgi:chemotaxis protein methyltransferase CheR
MIELVANRLGLQLNENRQRALVGVVEKLIAAGDFTDVNMLYAWLLKHHEQDRVWQQIVQALTVGETYFFRNQAHINALQYHVLPALINRRRQAGQRYLRLWCAGCATGEEPYSLAMLLQDLLPDIKQWSITLLGTDVNEAYLERAQDGIYRAHSFRGETPEWVQRRWFKANGGGTFELLPAIRDMVTFVPLNLLSDDYPAAANGTTEIDLILCRNVTIYFDRPTTTQIVERFFAALAPDSWLVVGHSEPQPGVYEAFESCNFENAILYRKLVENPKSTRPAPPVVKYEAPAPIYVKPAAPDPLPVESMPETLSIWEQARAAANSEHWEQAFRLLEQAEQGDVMQPHVHYLRGLMFMQMGNHTDARAALRQAIYCDPTFALAHYTLGDVHAMNGERREAQRHWQRAQKALHGLHPEAALPYADDLTVEMLSAILEYRLK